MKGEYYLGLDMGSSSVGWAVTNEKYEILRAHGKTLWGVRLFDSAQTAEERRGFRTAKRRLDRRNWRIELLQKIFAEEVVVVVETKTCYALLVVCIDIILYKYFYCQ